jgi:putative AlgH/UPF0301 family transcriptional regulator
MRSAQVSVGTTPTLLIDSDNINRQVHVHALSNTPVYLGGPDVSTTTGFLLEKDDGASVIEIPINEKLYAVVAAGTETVSVLLPDA